MEKDHTYYDQIVRDPRYANEPSGDEFPMFESLKLTIKRTLPYWNDVIVPEMKLGKRIIIAAHGNSLRGIIKYLDSEYSLYIVIIIKKALERKGNIELCRHPCINYVDCIIYI